MGHFRTMASHQPQNLSHSILKVLLINLSKKTILLITMYRNINYFINRIF